MSLITKKPFTKRPRGRSKAKLDFGMDDMKKETKDILEKIFEVTDRYELKCLAEGIAIAIESLNVKEKFKKMGFNLEVTRPCTYDLFIIDSSNCSSVNMRKILSKVTEDENRVEEFMDSPPVSKFLIKTFDSERDFHVAREYLLENGFSVDFDINKG
jgi:hypothetical protein